MSAAAVPCLYFGHEVPEDGQLALETLGFVCEVGALYEDVRLARPEEPADGETAEALR
jgi:hypothetical protein